MRQDDIDYYDWEKRPKMPRMTDAKGNRLPFVCLPNEPRLPDNLTPQEQSSIVGIQSLEDHFCKLPGYIRQPLSQNPYPKYNPKDEHSDPHDYRHREWEANWNQLSIIRKSWYRFVDFFNNWAPSIYQAYSIYKTVRNLVYICTTYTFDDLLGDELLQAQILMFVTQLAIRNLITNYTGNPRDYLPPPGMKLEAVVTKECVYFKHIYVPEKLDGHAEEVTVPE
jgi:hypothetical protein